MRVRAIFVDYGGVLMRTEDKGPRTRQAERLGMTYQDLVRLFFESNSAQRASTGEIPEEAHWQAVADTLGVSREEAGRIITEFFAGDRPNASLIAFLHRMRPERKVGLISNAWSGLRAYLISQNFEDLFDEMVISAEVGVMKPDPRIYHLALESLGVLPEESVFLDDLLINVEAARNVGMNAIHFTQPENTLDELKLLLNHHR